MFPIGNMQEEDGGKPGHATVESITWNGHSGLNPSLDAMNQAAQSAANHDTFMAGVFFGVASGTAVAFVEDLWKGRSGKKKKQRSGDQAGVIPAGDDHQ
jgi:hypothetical protein